MTWGFMELFGYGINLRSFSREYRIFEKELIKQLFDSSIILYYFQLWNWFDKDSKAVHYCRLVSPRSSFQEVERHQLDCVSPGGHYIWFAYRSIAHPMSSIVFLLRLISTKFNCRAYHVCSMSFVRICWFRKFRGLQFFLVSIFLLPARPMGRPRRTNIWNTLGLCSEGLTKILEENKGSSSKFGFRFDFRSYVRSFKNFNLSKSWKPENHRIVYFLQQ